MGYWFPPPPSAYDPTPRPLSHHTVVLGGETLEYPEVEDAEFFGVGLSEVKGADPIPSMFYVQPGMSRTGKGNHVKTFEADWGSGGPQQSPKDRLRNYQKLIALRAPEDPEGGGLAADVADPDGALTINYFDFSDAQTPRRKRVHLAPKKGGVDIHVEEWNPNEQRWGDEPFDFERDFEGSLVPIMQGLQVVTSAIVGVLATPAAGAAWSAAMQLGVNQAAMAAPPSVGEAFATFGTLAGSLNIGAALASPDSKAMLAGLYKSIKGAVGQDFLDRMQGVVDAAAKTFPKVNLSAALAGMVPDELIALDHALMGPTGPAQPGSSSDAFAKATEAFAALKNGAPESVAYSIRKTLDVDIEGLPPAKAAFDLTLASLKAKDRLGPEPWELADMAGDSGATLTVAQVIAMGKQSVQQKGDLGAMSFRQVYTQSPGALRQQAGAAEGTQKIVAAAGLLALLGKLFFF